MTRVIRISRHRLCTINAVRVLIGLSMVASTAGRLKSKGRHLLPHLRPRQHRRRVQRQDSLLHPDLVQRRGRGPLPSRISHLCLLRRRHGLLLGRGPVPSQVVISGLCLLVDAPIPCWRVSASCRKRQADSLCSPEVTLRRMTGWRRVAPKSEGSAFKN